MRQSRPALVGCTIREMGTKSGHIIHNWLHIEAVNVPGGGDRSREVQRPEKVGVSPASPPSTATPEVRQ